MVFSHRRSRSWGAGAKLGGRLTNILPNTPAAYMHVLQINQPHAPIKARPARVIAITKKERPRWGGGGGKGLKVIKVDTVLLTPIHG
jgi:hypothetical protein